MENFGKKIRQLREDKKLPLRTVAAFLDIDQALLSKIERGQRKANKDLVLKLSEFFNVDENELLLTWLSDKLVYELNGEDLALKALRVAEEKAEYLNFNKTDRKEIVLKIKLAFKQFEKIRRAWIFGSFSRENDGPKSDIDIAIETDKGFSYFDLAEVQHVLKNKINRKIDIGFIDSFKPYIENNIRPDLKLIYER
jgi:predicted nucleotidyltransferase/plasmid maintenance system antidote protein VapI